VSFTSPANIGSGQVKLVKAAVQVATLLLISLTIASCGGGSGDGSNSFSSSNSRLDGTWQSSDCEFAASGVSTTDEITFSGNSFTFSSISFLDNTLCASELTQTIHIDGTFNLPTGSAQSNNALPMDLTFLRGRLTASDALIAVLSSQGTTLQDVLTAEGITDINNIPLSMILPSTELYTIFERMGNTLRLGDDSPSFDGSTPELRHVTLGDDVLTLAGSGGGEVLNDNVANSRVIGVAFDQGELENSFDFATGLVITNLVGGGAYMVLDNNIVIQTSTAPSDFDFDAYFQATPSPMVLGQLGIPESDIFPPLEPGFTFDFRGEFNTPGMGGPTFRSIVFTRDSLFELTNNSLFSSPVVSSSGTYGIAGNSIELRFGDGTVERLLFATDGSSTVIIGQQRYLAS